MSKCLTMVIGSSTNRYTITQKALSMYRDNDQWIVVVNGEKINRYTVMKGNSKNINTIIAVSTIHSPSQWLRSLRRFDYVAQPIGAKLIETKLYHNSVSTLHLLR